LGHGHALAQQCSALLINVKIIRNGILSIYALRMEETGGTEMLLPLTPATWCYIPENVILICCALQTSRRDTCYYRVAYSWVIYWGDGL